MALVLCPAACKRRPAATKRCATGVGWRNKASGVTAGGGGSAAAIWRAFVYGRPECAAPAPTRPPGGDHEDLLVLRVPRPLLLDPAGAVAGGRVSWQACGEVGGGVSRAEGATHRRDGRRAAAHALLRARGPRVITRLRQQACARARAVSCALAAAPAARRRARAPPGAHRLARPLGARFRRARAARAESYKGGAPGALEGGRGWAGGHARLVAVRRRLWPLPGGPGRPPGAQGLARALAARYRRARAGSAQSYNMPGWRGAVGGQEGTRG